MCHGLEYKVFFLRGSLGLQGIGYVVRDTLPAES